MREVMQLHVTPRADTESVGDETVTGGLFVRLETRPAASRRRTGCRMHIASGIDIYLLEVLPVVASLWELSIGTEQLV